MDTYFYVATSFMSFCIPYGNTRQVVVVVSPTFTEWCVYIVYIAMFFVLSIIFVYGYVNHIMSDFEKPLPGDDKPIPYFLIGDDAFTLKTWMIKSYSAHNLSNAERLFNYRLSWARRIVENAFGILANRPQCLLSTLQLAPEGASTLVMASVTLHNLMCIRYPGLQNQHWIMRLRTTKLFAGPGETRVS